MDFIIRKATVSDLPAVLNLYQLALEDKEILSLTEAESIFAKMNTYPSYTLYVAEIGQEIVGTFALLVMDNLGHKGSPSAIIEDVAVMPSYQNRGLGKKMMAFAINCCQKAGCYKLALSSNSKRKTAHAFYESLGFVRHGYSFLIDI